LNNAGGSRRELKLGKTVVLVRIKQPEPSIPQLELMMTGTG
jgi:hypothetical protein